MKKNKISAVFLLLCLLLPLLCMGSAAALDDPEVSAPNVVLAETETGEVFFARAETARVYPASLTKIMTVLLAVEAIERGETSLDAPIMASPNITYDLEADGSSAGITAGEVLPLESLLQCALVASANEACNIIAEHICGTAEAFIARMNARAAELGCTDTHFANTHGLPNEDHYTTAWDLYLIAREAVSHEIFANICSMQEITVPATEGSGERVFRNTNALLGDNEYYKGYFYEGANGVKTGHTNAAGYCLIATASRSDIHLISVVLGTQAVTKEDGTLEIGSFTDTAKLFDWAFSNYSYRDILRSTEIVADLPIEMGSADMISVRPQSSIQALLPNDLPISDFTREITYTHEENGETLTAPVNAGDVLGEITVSRGGKVYGRAALVATKSVALSRMEFIKSEIRAFFRSKAVRIVILALIVLILLYIFLVIRYQVLHRKHVRSVKAARIERDRRAMQAAQEKQQAAAGRSAPRVDAPAIVPEDPVWPDAPKKPDAGDAAQRDYFEEFFKK